MRLAGIAWTAPMSSTAWPRPDSTSTSPAVLRALGPISQPILPAPSCTGAPTILQRIVFPTAKFECRERTMASRRYEQAELAIRNALFIVLAA
jgi:hypothetical protein